MSSRDRRSRGSKDDNPFFVQDETPELTFESVDRKGYSSGPLEDSLQKHINARPVSIFDIHPDPMQPRRTIPFAVRQQWDGEMGSLFDMWADGIAAERGDDSFHIEPFLQAAEDAPRSPQPQPLEAALLKVIDLAASIRRDGLTNPITVFQDARGAFYLETGERRWLAYHLLYRVEGDAWARIPARRMDGFSVWRQAGENNARDNLNAIAKARQFAILLMDLLHQEKGVQFQPFDAFMHEQDFYAQVADGEQWRVPKGKGELLLAAMSLRSVRQLSQHRTLLTLPNEAWVIADDYGLTEYRLRQILDLKLDDFETIEQVRQAALEFGDDSGTVVPVSAEVSNQTDEAEKPKRLTTRASIVERMALQAVRVRRSAQQAAMKRDRVAHQQLLEFAEDQVEWWRKFAESLKK